MEKIVCKPLCLNASTVGSVLFQDTYKDQEVSIYIYIWDIYMGVSENSGTPKSSMLIGFSIINHPFWGTPILETPIYIQTVIQCYWSGWFSWHFGAEIHVNWGSYPLGFLASENAWICYHPFIDFPQEWSGQLTKNSRLGFLGLGWVGVHFFLPHSWILLTCSPFIAPHLVT